MSGRGRTAGQVVAAIFLAVVGAVFLLTGGGCTVIWIAIFIDEPGSINAQTLSFAAPILLICAGLILAGYLALRSAIRTLRGPAEPDPRPEAERLPPPE